ncbi:MAG: S41 family peptidase, partial [Bacteroidetes bacterium]|nr:S41 family peptidase [Bacteroidota bacterium]
AVYEELVTGYVDDLDAARVMRTGLEAMLDDLDPYTVFFDEADNADIDILTRGKYGGVGLNVQVRNGRITVSSPIEGANGYKQGVRAGDIITHVAETPIDGLSLSDVRNLMRGEPGTTVEVVIEREGEPEALRFILTREEVTIKNVTYTAFVDDDTASGLGYIKLERFARGASRDVRGTLQEMQKAGPVRGVILDLRDNPGGLLEDAFEITELFVPQGVAIVSTRGRTPETERVYRSKTPPLLPETPVVILVNELSASASEIVAGAIQDVDRGLIVGTTSFGKGLVQIVKPLPYNTSLKLTTSRYYTPSGRSIQAIDYSLHDGDFEQIPDSLRRTFKTAAGRPVQDRGGIMPDVEVSLGEVSELEQALRRRAAFFFFANHYAATHKIESEAGEERTAEERFFRGENLPAAAVDLDLDVILEEFQAWLATQEFFYRPTAARALDQLDDDLQAMGYAEADDEVAALRQAVLKEKDADFDRHTARLKELLRAEIVARYVGRAEQIKASLASDPQFRKAVALLQDPDAYARALGQ